MKAEGLRNIFMRVLQVHGLSVGSLCRGVPRHLHCKPGCLHDYKVGEKIKDPKKMEMQW